MSSLRLWGLMEMFFLTSVLGQRSSVVGTVSHSRLRRRIVPRAHVLGIDFCSIVTADESWSDHC